LPNLTVTEPTAVQEVGEAHETPLRLVPWLTGGFEVDATVQVDPFHVSIRTSKARGPLKAPAATQKGDAPVPVQETLFNPLTLVPGSWLSKVIDQVVPFQRAAIGINPAPPTATQ
jgi:hypothetical protein